jgi:hypothetical protein
MLSTKAHTKFYSPNQVAQLARAVSLHNVPTSSTLLGHSVGLRGGCAAVRYGAISRSFSTTPATQLRDFFPVKETKQIKKTPTAWRHPGWTEEQMLSVVPAHREPRTTGDWVAWKLVRFCRYWMDKVTGLSEGQQSDKKNPTTAIVAEKPLTEAQWVSISLRARLPRVFPSARHLQD